MPGRRHGIGVDLSYIIRNRWGTIVTSGTAHNTPTDILVDDIVNELAVGNYITPIARLYLIDDQGAFQDYADITPDMWTTSVTEYGVKATVTVTVTVTRAYNLKGYTLVDTSLSKRYFEHILAGAISVSAGYSVQITWEIIIEGDGNNITSVYYPLLNKIIGTNTNPVKIATIEAWYDGQQIASTSDFNIYKDTENNKIVIQGSITFPSAQEIDTLRFKDGTGATIFDMYIGARSVEAGVQYPLSIEVTIQIA